MYKVTLAVYQTTSLIARFTSVKVMDFYVPSEPVGRLEKRLYKESITIVTFGEPLMSLEKKDH